MVVFLVQGGPLLLVGAVFLVIFHPFSQVPVTELLLDVVGFLQVPHGSQRPLLGRVVLHGLPFLGRGLHTPFLLGLVHFLEGVTLLLVDLRERLVKLLPCKGLAFPYTFLHDRYACRLKFLLRPDTGVGELVLIIPGRFARILGFLFSSASCDVIGHIDGLGGGFYVFLYVSAFFCILLKFRRPALEFGNQFAVFRRVIIHPQSPFHKIGSLACSIFTNPFVIFSLPLLRFPIFLPVTVGPVGVRIHGTLELPVLFGIVCYDILAGFRLPGTDKGLCQTVIG